MADIKKQNSHSKNVPTVLGWVIFVAAVAIIGVLMVVLVKASIA